MTPAARERVAAALVAQSRGRYLAPVQRAHAANHGLLSVRYGQPRAVTAMLELPK
ncbi:MAG: hypothetical protein ACRCXL_15650 [Dermatophilaceae bacterium]